MTLGEEILKQERIEKQETPQPKRGTSDLLYDSSGEPVSDEVWEKRLQEE